MHSTRAETTPPQLTAHEMVQDLRGPLTSLVAATGLLTTGQQPEELSSQVETVRHYAQRLSAALNDLENLETLLRGSGVPLEEAFDLPQLLQGSTDQMTSVLAGRTIELLVDLDRKLPRWVQGDPTRLRHLIERSLDVMTQHCTISPVHFSVSADESFLRVSIVHRDPNANVEGSLSLALCQNLATFLKAELAITRPGNDGLSLLLTLPLVLAPDWEIELLEEDTVRSPSSPSSPCKVTGSVLLIENSPDHLPLIAKMVNNLGAQVTTAGSAEIARYLLDNLSFDLVLLDMSMPQMDAYASVKALRERSIATPVLALTTGATAAEFERCLAAGCNGYIAKPIDASVLRHNLAMHLSAAR